MDNPETITITLPKGKLDSIESITTRPIEGYPGVSEVLINGEPGRLLVDLSQFENNENDLRRLYTGVGEGFIKHHVRKNNRS
jgi:hypothetical protein